MKNFSVMVGVWFVAGSMLWAAPTVKPVGVSVVWDERKEDFESDEGGSSRMGFFKKVTVQKSYNLKRKVKSFRVEVKVWTEMKEVEVPFDLTFGIGGVK